MENVFLPKSKAFDRSNYSSNKEGPGSLCVLSA